MVLIQKVNSYMSDYLHIIKCESQTGQDAKWKEIKKLRQEIKKLRANVDDFIIICFQLTFIPGTSKMLPQNFDHTF